jgi:NTP pyrophosphatase (non-canonical NTP hydrolase)
MDMNTYQALANRTDQHPLAPGSKPAGPEILVPLLGLAGEAGGLLSEYKKYLRDGESHRLFTERVAEELGDLLWYVANVATKFGLPLAEVAARNVEKCRDRWEEPEAPAPETPGRRPLFDERYPPHEQLPRRFVFVIKKAEQDGRVGVRVYIDGVEVETKLSDLSDNAYEDDGYRFHDVFHLAYAAILGWSPIIRSGLKRKRKSNSKTDEVEDGGRATAIEEGVSALVFSYAAEHNFLDGAEGVGYELLRVVKSMTAHLEVSRASARDWERAIVRGFEVWRAVKAQGGGAILADLVAGTIELVEDPIVVSA